MPSRAACLLVGSSIVNCMFVLKCGSTNKSRGLSEMAGGEDSDKLWLFGGFVYATIYRFGPIPGTASAHQECRSHSTPWCPPYTSSSSYRSEYEPGGGT